MQARDVINLRKKKEIIRVLTSPYFKSSWWLK